MSVKATRAGPVTLVQVSLQSKQLRDLDPSDIDELIGLDETPQLDFKLELPSGTEQDKLEFAADVCSMWRTGGNIVFGIRDEEGVATEVAGLGGGIDLDRAARTLDQLVESRVDPRLPDVQFGVIEHPAGPILVVRVAQSWQGPHGVRVGEGFRFPVRSGSARKTYLDFEQLRATFAGGEELRQRVQGFRDRRLAAVLSGDTPVPLDESGKTVTHVVPISAWLERREIDTLRLEHHDAFMPIPREMGGIRGLHELPNLDGLITFDEPREEEGPAYRYLQAFRDGALERVTDYLFQLENGRDPYPPKTMFGSWFERELVHGVKDALTLLRHVEVIPPVVVLPTLVGTRNWLLFTGNRDLDRDRRAMLPLQMDVMRLPDVVIDDFDADIPRVLRPTIDTFWQAGGVRRSPWFDDDGRWQLGERQ